MTLLPLSKVRKVIEIISYAEIGMLYPKSDGVPSHWPHQISCPMLHMSTHPRELSGEEQTNTIKGVSPGELTSNE